MSSCPARAFRASCPCYTGRPLSGTKGGLPRKSFPLIVAANPGKSHLMIGYPNPLPGANAPLIVAVNPGKSHLMNSSIANRAAFPPEWAVAGRAVPSGLGRPGNARGLVRGSVRDRAGGLDQTAGSVLILRTARGGVLQ